MSMPREACVMYTLKSMSGSSESGLCLKRRAVRGLARFAADTSGDIAIMVGLLAIVLFATLGSAVDMARWLHARQDTVTALDAAVLAGGRQLQLNGDEAAALRAAQSYYKANTRSRIPLATDTIAFKIMGDGLEFGVTGSATIATPFLSLIGIETMPLLNLSGSEFSVAKLAVGGNSDRNLEIALMLDVSGSMQGQKTKDMKAAAKDLVEIVVWDDQSEHTSRVAIVPFSAQVRLPEAMYNSVTDPGMKKTICKGSKCTVFKRDQDNHCVVERKGDERYTDDKPGTGAWIMPLYVREDDGACAVLATGEVVPLSNNKSMLKSRIDKLPALGGTAGHLGTAWAWYMLSPNWAGEVPSASEPAPYGAKDVDKIAILMTDGEYNTQYTADGISTGDSKRPEPKGAANDTSARQAVALCEGMKESGITVYTVGFALTGNDRNAIETLQACATTPGHAYLADDGNGLKQVFRDIALKISALYLSK